MSRRRYSMLGIVIVVLVIALGVFAVQSIDEIHKGTAENPASIPEIGDDLARFPISGSMTYLVHDGPRGETGFISGTMSDEQFASCAAAFSCASWDLPARCRASCPC
jgi:hypothetical protein